MSEVLTVPERIRLDPSAAAVIVIDAQNDFCHPDGVLARQGRDVGRVQEPLRRLGRLLDSARAAGVPVIFVQNIHDEETDTEQWRARHPDSDRAQSCQLGSWGAEFCGVAPAAGETVITKHRYSAFVNTPLVDHLARTGRRSLLFTGFTTSVCVESSVRDAVCHDFLATLVEDCCGAYSERAHQRAIESVELGFGVVTSSARATSLWPAGPQGPEPIAVASNPGGGAPRR